MGNATTRLAVEVKQITPALSRHIQTSSEQNAGHSSQPPPSSSNNTLWIVAAAAALLGGGAYLIYNSKDKKSVDPHVLKPVQPQKRKDSLKLKMKAQSKFFFSIS